MAHPKAGVGIVPGALHLDVVVCPGAGAVGVGGVRRAADGVRAAFRHIILKVMEIQDL